MPPGFLVTLSVIVLSLAACAERLPPPHACLIDSLPPPATLVRRWQPYRSDSSSAGGPIAYRMDLHSRWLAMDDGDAERGDTLQTASIWTVPGEGILSLALVAAPPSPPGVFLSGAFTECGVSWANWEGRVAVRALGTEKRPVFVIRGVWPIGSGRWGSVVAHALSVRAEREVLAALRTLAPDSLALSGLR